MNKLQSTSPGNSKRVSDSRSRLVTIFFSNHSGNCKALLQYIKNINLSSQISIKYINIDNEIMKDVIKKKFTVVPAMTVVQNDEISLFTGENVFEWFNTFEASLMDEMSSDDDVEQFKSQIEPQTTQKSEEPSTKKSILEIAAEISKARDQDKI